MVEKGETGSKPSPQSDEIAPSPSIPDINAMSETLQAIQ